MKNEISWKNFEKTGRVKDYLKLKALETDEILKNEFAEENFRIDKEYINLKTF